jgi:hypothetical protein
VDALGRRRGAIAGATVIALACSLSYACFIEIAPPLPVRAVEAGSDDGEVVVPDAGVDATVDPCARDADLPTCDADLNTDNFNCGECGHTCGSSCAGGTCAPTLVRAEPTTAMLADDPTLYYGSLSTGKLGIVSAAIDGDGDGGALCAAGITPFFMARTATTIYGLRYTDLIACPPDIGDGGTATTIKLPSPPVAGTLTANASDLFIAFQAPNQAIKRLDPNTNTFVEFVRGENVSYMRADATHVYWIGQSGGAIRLRRVSATNPLGGPDELGTLTAPNGLALSADDVFVADGDKILRIGKHGCPSTLQPVVSGRSNPSSPVAEGRYVYFTEQAASAPVAIWRADFLGDKAPLLMLPDAGGTDVNYALSEKWLLYSRGTGVSIRKIAK